MAHKITQNMTKWHVTIDYMCQMYYSTNTDFTIVYEVVINSIKPLRNVLETLG